MMSLTFDLFTQVSGSGPLGPLVLHLQPTYWIPLFEGNKLVIRVLFLTLIQHHIRNSRGNAFRHQN